MGEPSYWDDISGSNCNNTNNGLCELEQQEEEELAENARDMLRMEFLRACRLGKHDKVERLVRMPGGVDDVDWARSSDRVTGLQLASANNHVSTVERLLNHGADPTATNAYGWTPLMHAALHGHEDVVRRLLLDARCDVNAQSHLGASALTMSCRNGHLPVARLLIEANATVDVSAVLTSVLYGHEHLTKLLLEHYFDINAQLSYTGLSALMIAAVSGQMTLTELLESKGAKLDLTDVRKRTAIDLAREAEQTDVESMLKRSKAISSEQLRLGALAAQDGDQESFWGERLIEAIKSDNIAVIAECVNRHPDIINWSQTDTGATPLLVASHRGQFPVVSMLIENGADVNMAETRSKWTPFMTAAFAGHKDVAEKLLQSGADPRAMSHDGFTGFDLALLADDTDPGLLFFLAKSTNRNGPIDVRRYKTRGLRRVKHWFRGVRRRLRASIHSAGRQGNLKRSNSSHYKSSLPALYRSNCALAPHDLTTTMKATKFRSCDNLLFESISPGAADTLPILQLQRQRSYRSQIELKINSATIGGGQNHPNHKYTRSLGGMNQIGSPRSLRVSLQNPGCSVNMDNQVTAPNLPCFIVRQMSIEGATGVGGFESGGSAGGSTTASTNTLINGGGGNTGTATGTPATFRSRGNLYSEALSPSKEILPSTPGSLSNMDFFFGLIDESVVPSWKTRFLEIDILDMSIAAQNASQMGDGIKRPIRLAPPPFRARTESASSLGTVRKLSQADSAWSIGTGGSGYCMDSSGGSGGTMGTFSGGTSGGSLGLRRGKKPPPLDAIHAGPFMPAIRKPSRSSKPPLRPHSVHETSLQSLTSSSCKSSSYQNGTGGAGGGNVTPNFLAPPGSVYGIMNSSGGSVRNTSTLPRKAVSFVSPTGSSPSMTGGSQSTISANNTVGRSTKFRPNSCYEINNSGSNIYSSHNAQQLQHNAAMEKRLARLPVTPTRRNVSFFDSGFQNGGVLSALDRQRGLLPPIMHPHITRFSSTPHLHNNNCSSSIPLLANSNNWHNANATPSWSPSSSSSSGAKHPTWRGSATLIATNFNSALRSAFTTAAIPSASILVNGMVKGVGNYSRDGYTRYSGKGGVSVETLLTEQDQRGELGDIYHLLKQVHLEEYLPLFDQEEITDLETFLSLTDRDLREMGIGDSGSRSEILRIVRELSDNPALMVHPRKLASSS